MSDYGLIGASLGYSFSKRIHEAIFRQFGRSDLRYDLIEQDSLRLLHGYRGFNITIPYKEAVIPLLDRVEKRALAMRSVNTVVCCNDLVVCSDDLVVCGNASVDASVDASTESPGAGDVFRVGYNTDWAGLEAILPADIAQYRAAVILGTGASARMAASVLRARGIQNLAWISRRKEGQREMMSASRACCPSRQERVAGASMAPEMMCCYEELESAARYGSNPLADLIARRPVILVNATPVGTLGNPAPLLVSEETIARFDAVIDLVYNPPETKLIAIARRGSAYTATGIEMLIMQAIEAQILWGTIPQAAWKNDRRAFVRALAARIREDLGI